MDWIIGGTKDSRDFIESLLKQNKNNIIVTTATPYGKKLLEEYPIDVIVKPMDIDEMREFIKKYSIKRIFDFSHPYAQEVSKNAMDISKVVNILYYRFERENLEINSFNNKNIIYFTDIFEITKFISNLNKNILVTLGSNTIEKFKNLPNLKNIYFRILPTTLALGKLEECGIMAKNIIALQGPFSYDFNLAILKNYKIDYLVTKESGTTGGELEKIKSALDIGAKVLILRRPAIQYPWVSNSIEEILKIYLDERN
ncbi:precorrin-6A reductase [uncultured Fusobacterium sp.]|uniref:precorrin-6A reductase n=1 Tax=uncultured Fusobacterium sp. TaxID=159267 RepID=UPI0015A537FC|nr:precorrin-6A reductase [uncultured Fusobacterium sp.]